MRTDAQRDHLPIVEYTRPRCPHCNSTRLRANKSITDFDEVVTRYSACRDCGAKVCVIAK